jgi:DNA-nicking Smr family endonuclease
MGKAAGNAAPDRNDRTLWAETVRDVTPLPGRAPPPAAAPAIAAFAAENRPAAAKPGPIERFAGIDRANAERLKRGRHPISAQLDLHGLTQAEAHRQLIRFVEGSYQAGQRCVLIITGRGLGPEGPGVLKGAVPRWLAESELRRRVLAVAEARPRDGGAGALYLLLRRQRR